jgi:hypothetical protein
VTAVVLLILALIWAAVLVPPWLQSRRENRPGDSIASFRNQLNVLERATPGLRSSDATVTRLRNHRHTVPSLPVSARLTANSASGRLGRPGAERALPRRADVRRRRRDVFLTLLGAVGLTFVLAVILGGPVWGLHAIVDVLFVGYVGMLIKLQQQASEREMKLRYLPTAPRTRQSEPALLLRRSAN